MSYAGNPSLPGAVKDRVTSTFQQALTLYNQGRMDEVAAGCTLVLQMDAGFEPARKLLDKVRNPSLPIDVNSLLPAETRSQMDQAREAMASRDFQRVIHVTTEILTEDLLNDEARVLGDEAREKLEAAPFVDQFTRRSEGALASGNVAAAKMDLEKARALDPTHPDVVRIAKAIAARGAAPTAAQPTPSFVVEDRPPAATAGRGTAQASDFGFTFEEEKPAEVSFSNFSFDDAAPAPAPAEPSFANFSFDTPSSDTPFSFGSPAPAAGAPPREFDFATAAVETDDDEQKKIEQYIADGDRAFAAGEYQQAIDLWSRIFLIDVTNDVASDRIERAKGKRREIEQKLETVLASGVEAFERGDTATAHAELSEVLRLDPNNITAQDYLDRLSETLTPGRARTDIPAPPEESYDSGFYDDELPPGVEAPLVPPDPGAAPVPKAAKTTGKLKAAPAKARPARKAPMGAIAALLGVILLAGGGWFVWSRFMQEPEVEASTSDAVLARATTLAGAGQYDKAIALLRDIQPGDPLHDRALVMISDLQQKKSTSAQLIDGIPAEQFFAQHLAAARTAFDAHDYVAAKAELEQAMRVKALPPDLKALYDQASEQAAKLDAAKALFAERKYRDAISSLEPLLAADPQNASIKRLMVNAHFNLGAMALQEERIDDAVREFDEVLKVNEADELARRSRDLAMRYEDQPKDLLYKIYVKYLPLREAS